MAPDPSQAARGLEYIFVLGEVREWHAAGASIEEIAKRLRSAAARYQAEGAAKRCQVLLRRGVAYRMAASSMSDRGLA